MRQTVNTKLLIPFAVLILAFIITGSSSAEAVSEDILPACSKDGKELDAEKLPDSFDLSDCPTKGKVIKDGVVGVEVPPVGEGISAHVSTIDGVQELSVEHRKNGTIELKDTGEEKQESGTSLLEESLFKAQGGIRACRDRAYNLSGVKVYGKLKWHFNRSTTPRNLRKKKAQQQLIAAVRNITGSRNNCRMPDRVSAKQSFLGNTSSRAQLNRDGYCKGGLDTKNVVSFGRLPSNYTAMTCTAYYFDSPYDRVKGSDIKINRGVRWSTNRRTCRGKKLDLQSTMTHEFGHTFGLEHVSEEKHGNLTMSSGSNGYCVTSNRTLGRGDVLGLRVLY